MNRHSFSLLIALVALSFTPRPPLFNPHPAAIHYVASIKGSNQGLFKAATNSPGGQETQGWMEIFNFSLGAANPVNTGQGSGGAKAGKVVLQPLTITKKTDGFSSLFNISLATNEKLDTVIIQARDDQNNVTQTTVIRNARIKEIKKNGNDEIVSLVFEQIERK
jgi:type VI secretion system Hcp family effector